MAGTLADFFITEVRLQVESKISIHASRLSKNKKLEYFHNDGESDDYQFRPYLFIIMDPASNFSFS